MLITSTFLLVFLAHLVRSAEYTITVGSPLHQFGGNGIIEKAAVGDTVKFEFHPPKHSVVRAAEGVPCVPYETTDRGKQGFSSGMVTVKDGPYFNWTLRINDTEPIYFYCSAPGSCVDFKMVGGINVDRSALDYQISLIDRGTIMLQPGEPIPLEGTPIPAAAPTAEPHAHQGLSTGAIVGIAVSGAAVLALAAALFFLVGRAKTLEEAVDGRIKNASTQTSHPGMSYYSPAPVHISPGFEGCMRIKEDGGVQVPLGMPPIYASQMNVHAAARTGTGGEYTRDSAVSPGLDKWKMTMYDEPPRETDGGNGYCRMHKG